MTAVILPFPGQATDVKPIVGDALAIFEPARRRRHLPLVEAAMDLMHADDAELQRRCTLMRDADGERMAAALAFQLEMLGDEVAAAADTLTMTAVRVRHAMQTQE